ncbi:MAG: uracil-DNA glycosylase family protein [Candidatus Brachytrichaceae bacterium NZ_4S206]
MRKLPETVELFSRYAPLIAALPSDDYLTKDDLLISAFLLHKENQLEIYYAPFDYVNENAKIVLVGITPGWTQMEIGYRAARQGLQLGMSPREVCAYAKRQASFAGSMRKNLINMLDGLELPENLGIKSSELLFSDYRDLLHTTSAIRYPVFVNRQNYTGHRPELLSTPVLRKYVEEVLAAELRLASSALIVPLGKSVSAVLRILIDNGLLDSGRCLLGFPHPSGANGHRAKQFASMQPDLKRTIKAWFKPWLS